MAAVDLSIDLRIGSGEGSTRRDINGASEEEGTAGPTIDPSMVSRVLSRAPMSDRRAPMATWDVIQFLELAANGVVIEGATRSLNRSLASSKDARSISTCSWEACRGIVDSAYGGKGITPVFILTKQKG